MNYRLDSSFTYTRETRRKKRTLLIFAVAVALVLGFGEVFFRALSGPVNLIFQPVFSSLGNGWGNAKVRELEAENNRLKTEMLVLKQRSSDLSLLRSELGLSEVAKEGTVSKVINRPSLTPFDILIIDAGQKNSRGLEVGKVVGSSGALIGQIVEVNDYSSKVRLFSSPGLEVPVLVGNIGVAQTAGGRGGGNLRVSLPRGVPIEVGEPIRAAAYPGFLLGVVDHLDVSPENPFQEISFRLPVNIFELGWVTIYD